MMEIRGRLFWIAWLSAAWFAAAEYGWKPSGFPNPNMNPAKCGRPDVARSSVCDPDSVLSMDTRVALDGLINQIQAGEGSFAKSQCGASQEGFQIGVAVMNKISPAYIGGDDVDEAAVWFAKELHDSWGVGNAACNNGVMLLISVKDRYMYISTGKGAKGRLTESRIANVVNEAKQLFRRGKYDQGTEVAVQMMGDYLAQELSTGEKIWSRVEAIFGFVIGLFFNILLGCIGAATVYAVFSSVRGAIRKNTRKKDLRGKLKKLQDERDQARDRPSFESSSCPICLEEWAATPTDDEGQAKRILPCGHAFHAKCIEDWLRTAPQSQCPICKRNVFGNNDAGSSTGSTPCQQQATTEADQAFRLGRLHDMYPDFVTEQLLFNWRAQAHADYLQELDSQIALQEAQAQHAARVAAGTSGSGFSFGGGSSLGGGGGGGGW